MQLQSITLLAFSASALAAPPMFKRGDGFSNIGFYTDNTCTTLIDGSKTIDIKYLDCTNLTGLVASDNVGINWGFWDGSSGDGLQGLTVYTDDACKLAAQKKTPRPDADAMHAQGANSCFQPQLASGQTWLSVQQFIPCGENGYC